MPKRSESSGTPKPTTEVLKGWQQIAAFLSDIEQALVQFKTLGTSRE